MIHDQTSMPILLVVFFKYRTDQYDRKQAVSKKCNASDSETMGWIESQLRKIDHMSLAVTKNVEQLKTQFHEIKVQSSLL